MSRTTQIAVVALLVLVGALTLGIYLALMDSESALDAPQFGDPTQPKEVANGESGQNFISFLDANAARKVYINVVTAQAPQEFVDPNNSVRASGLVLRDETNKTNPLQHIRLVKDGRDQYEVNYSGDYGWRLRGYFAVDGLISARMGLEARELIPIDLDEAVN